MSTKKKTQSKKQSKKLTKEIRVQLNTKNKFNEAAFTKYNALRKQQAIDKIALGITNTALNECAELCLGELTENKIDSLHHGTGTFFQKVVTNVLVSNKIELFKFLRKKGQGDCIQETVHPQTLKSVLKELTEASVKIPKNMVLIDMPTILGYRKS